MSGTNIIFYHFGPFFALLPNKLKSQNLEQMKNTWRYYQSTHACHKWQSYGVWFLRYRAWRIEFSVILDHSLLFNPANSPKNQNFEKTTKAPVDIIILHMCTKTHNQIFLKMKKIPGDIIILHTRSKNNGQMMYDSWNMVRNGTTDGRTEKVT